MQKELCRNFNHSRSNVTVRYCSQCGEVVNRRIPGGGCSNESHAEKRKARDKFCIDCGKDLIS